MITPNDAVEGTCVHGIVGKAPGPPPGAVVALAFSLSLSSRNSHTVRSGPDMYKKSNKPFVPAWRQRRALWGDGRGGGARRIGCCRDRLAALRVAVFRF